MFHNLFFLRIGCRWLGIVLLLSQCLPVLLSADLEYNRDVRPILAENCFACHGFDKAKREAGLRLDTPAGGLAKLDSGEVAIVPGKPEESELVKRILSSDDAIMPPHESGKKLTDSQKKILTSWVEHGAAYDKHWAFIPPKKVQQPTVVSVGIAPSNPIDNFVLARLTKEGLAPSPEADPITFIRRLKLDLIGLPPTISEVDEYVAAFSVNADLARRELVDHLLRSPHYGERWGRWWLDQARYADSNGYSVDAPRQIWKYRDWVIDVLNRDLPFNQFTIEQIAGDLLPNATEEQTIATGFHRNTQINQEGGIDPEQFRIDSVFDRVATTGTVWLGLTIGCAQCHDHKFDPIEQKEYYRFFAFFNNQEEPNLTIYEPELKAPALFAEQKELELSINDIVTNASDAIRNWEESLTEVQSKSLSKEMQKLVSGEKSKRTIAQLRSLYAMGPGASDEHFRTIQSRLKEIEKLLSAGISTMVMRELPIPRKTNLFIQGDFTRPADEVTCGTPAVLPPIENPEMKLNRLDLARWLVSSNNPLSSRVIVNRVWQHYFGRGIVETENDFGLQGSPPSHPELLDWLAVEFVERGWSLKELHRLIVSSKTYQQSSVDRADLREKDHGNYLLARQRRMRLEGEIVRDVELAACGLLSSKIGGPSVYPPIPQGVMGQGQVKREWKVSSGEDRYRRGLYTFVYRATPPPSLNVFDAPDGFSTCTRRVRSNTPLQALTLMNDAGFFEFAKALEKIIREEGMEVAFRRCASRHPRPVELTILQSLDPLSAARALLNLDETVTRE